MRIKPFYCKCESEEQVKELLEKSVLAGANECETLKEYNWNYFDCWGIDNEGDTRSLAHKVIIDSIAYWGDAVQIDFKDLDKHLGLVKETNKNNEPLLTTEQRKQKILELMKLPQHHTIDDWMAGMRLYTINGLVLDVVGLGEYVDENYDICNTKADFEIKNGVITYFHEGNVDKITYEGVTIWEFSEVEERKYDINKELQELEEKMKVLKSELSKLNTNE